MTEVECFDPLSNDWTVSAQLPESRSEAGAVVIWCWTWTSPCTVKLLFSPLLCSLRNQSSSSKVHLQVSKVQAIIIYQGGLFITRVRFNEILQPEIGLPNGLFPWGLGSVMRLEASLRHFILVTDGLTDLGFTREVFNSTYHFGNSSNNNVFIYQKVK